MVERHARLRVAFKRKLAEEDQGLNRQISQHSIRLEHNIAEAKESEAVLLFRGL